MTPVPKYVAIKILKSRNGNQPLTMFAKESKQKRMKTQPNKNALVC